MTASAAGSSVSGTVTVSASATDNVGVSGYTIYRGAAQIATTSLTSYSGTGLSPSTAYTYTVAAYDAAGNVSAQSAARPPLSLRLFQPWWQPAALQVLSLLFFPDPLHSRIFSQPLFLLEWRPYGHPC